MATGEAVWQRLIPNEKARQVQAVLEEYDLFVEYYSQGKATTRQGDPERAFTHFGLPESKRHFLDKDYCLVSALGGHLQESGLQPEKINLPYLPPRPCARRSGSAWRHWAAWSSPPPSRTTWRSRRRCGQGRGLTGVSGTPGHPSGGRYGLGDNGNDVTMLRYAGVSVCMGDGSEEAKAAAKYLTGPHTEDGLAQAIERFAFA